MEDFTKYAALAVVLSSVFFMPRPINGQEEDEERPAPEPAAAPSVDPETMVKLDGGEFQMGREFEEPGRYGDSWFINQTPATTVRLDEFHLDKHEVTVGEFALFLTHAAGDFHYDARQPIERVRDGYLPVEGSEDEPIRQVTWQAAAHYCEWAGKRLPTEAEWEFAAEGTEGREYPWGSEEGPSCERAVFYRGASYCETSPQPVGSHEAGATPDGVHDLAGNVAEWVSDYYGRYEEMDGVVENPTGPGGGELRVVRGGGFMGGGKWLRSNARWGADPKHRSANIGFRCAWDGESPDDVARGELVTPVDVEREDRPAVDPMVEFPPVLADGFSDPGAIIRIADRFYVLDRGNGAIVSVDPMSGESEAVLEGLEGADRMVSDGASLYVTLPDAGEVVAYHPDGDADETIASGESGLGPIAADESGVVWAADGAVRSYDASSGTTDDYVTGFVGIVALELGRDSIYVNTDGGGNVSDTAAYRVARGAVDPQPEVVFDQGTLGQQLYPSHVIYDPEADRTWVMIKYRRFPNNGWLCHLDDAEPTCLTYSPPPRDESIVVQGSLLLWPARNALMRFDASVGGTFSFVYPWTRVGGIWADDERVVWTDRQNGRVFDLEL